ncbi:hypothetical protein Q1695_013470 [Nippostrongylus brasiliensis]|nr:hypothetical protein Q1695_013470 [Nippostrongylus brasiliensis]
MLPILLLLVLSSCAAEVSDLSRCPYDFFCLNGGLCDSDGRCVCKTGWTGRRCELESTPCPDRECVNGYCERNGNGQPYCVCDHRFEGQFCDLDKNECVLGVCPVDAICVNLTPKLKTDKGYSCICPDGYAGEHCELEVDLCDLYRQKGENYCHHGGVCEARYICMCQNGFGGPRCGHRVPRLEEYREFGCPERPEVCAKLFDDGKCDQVCNRETCLFDGFDCAVQDGAVCRNPADCAYKYGDGKCDIECAGPECGYDGGDCEGFNKTSHHKDTNVIGVAVGVPPDVAVKNLRHLQAELAQQLYTHVSLAEDANGVMIFEWDIDSGQGNRISVIDEEVVASSVRANVNGTMIFFDVDTLECRIRYRKSQIRPRCFTDVRAAATYLTLELTRRGSLSGEKLPIQDISWRSRELQEFEFSTSPLILTLICAVVLVILLISCTGIIVAIVRVRRRRQTTVFAPCWKVPNSGNSNYHPPTPPYSSSPEYQSNGVSNNKTNGANSEKRSGLADLLAPIVDATSPLLAAVRRGDHETVKEMISSKETFTDAIFERNAAGQSPLVFAARVAHPGLECVSLLVAAIDTIRKRRRDDFLSLHFQEIQKDRRNLLKMLPLHDEAEASCALTDSMGRNVIHYAALCNASHLVNYFAACGANVNLIDNNGDAPIHLAARDANVEALVALLRNNCDVDIQDAFDRTAYEIADSHGHSVVCGLFLIARNASSTELIEQMKDASMV